MTEYAFERIENFRDLAQYPCRYGKPTSGVLYRSGSPFYGSPADFALLREIGIRSVIDLRGERITNLSPSPFRQKEGVYYIAIEVPHGENFAALETQVPGWYLSFIEDPYVSRKFFKAIVNAPKPLMFHCEAGKDRTGVFAALLLLANGVSREDVCRDYLISYDGRLVETEKRTIEEVPALQHFVFHPNSHTIETFLDLFFERYGDVESYLEAMGLTESEITSLCNILGTQEMSAGAVVFHEEKVLIEHMVLGHYAMPKGRVGQNDPDLIEVAHREILDETGVDVRIDPDFCTTTVYSPRDGAIKQVVWFLAEAESEATHFRTKDVLSCHFLTPVDAMRVLTHEEARRVLSEACEYRYQD